MRRCKLCGTLRTAGDPCPGADCPKNLRPTLRLRAKTLPVTATHQHGFHAPTTSVTRLLDDYDLPIRARHWRHAR